MYYIQSKKNTANFNILSSTTLWLIVSIKKVKESTQKYDLLEPLNLPTLRRDPLPLSPR